MRINLSLTKKGAVDKAIKQLEDYKTDLLDKTELFVTKLIDKGIASGIANSGEYKGMIVFRPANESVFRLSDGVEGILVPLFIWQMLRLIPSVKSLVGK